MQSFFWRFLLVILSFGAQGAYSQAPATAMVQELPELRAIVDATGFEGSVLIYDLHNNAYMAGHA